MVVRSLALIACVACSAASSSSHLFAGSDGPELAADRARAELGSADLEVLRSRVDALGMAHVRLQQHHEGVQVRGGQVSIHYTADGAVRRVTDHRLHDLELDTVPAFDRDTAILGAAEDFGIDRISVEPVAKLQIARLDGTDHLVWSVILEDTGQAHPEFLFDAHTGQLLQISDTLERATGTGTTTHYGTVNLNTVKKNGKFYLEYRDARLGTFDGCGSKTNLQSKSDNDNVWNGSAKRDVVNVHYAASAWYDYFDTAHDHQGIDGNHGPGLKGAKKDSWNVLSIGTGFGTYWSSGAEPHACISGGSAKLDIVGHELGHAWLDESIDFVAGDVQTEALEESLSDIAGALVEESVLGAGADRWRIGEGTWTLNVRSLEDPPSEPRFEPFLVETECWVSDDPTQPPRRSLIDPDALTVCPLEVLACPPSNEWEPVSRGTDQRRQVDHMDDFVTTTCGFTDSRQNSGIPNHAFYELQADIGVDDAGDIWFRAVDLYLTDTADFADARQAMEDAAEDLFGAASTEVTAVGDAWDHVGVE